MRFIVFAAYKGGVGRTTASVSVGNALARCGKRVLLVDMDLDAPSLPAFYGLGVFEHDWLSDRAQGVVPWIMNEGDISEHLIEIRTGLGDAETGSIHVLPAGQLGPEYIPSTMSPRFRSFFETGSSEIARTSFSEHLKAALENSNESFDFVIIDARSGLGPVSQHLLTMPATVVFLTLGEPDSLTILGRYLKLSENAALETDFLGVLSRAPLFGFEGDNEFRRALGRLRELCGDNAVVLREQPGREIRMEATISETEEEALSLAHDHITLMLRIAPELDPSADGLDETEKQTRLSVADTNLRGPLADAAEWAHKEDPYIVWKMFRRDLGVMMNNDDTRNVAFRVETIESVFSRIAEEVREHYVQLERWRRQLSEQNIDLDSLGDLNRDYLRALFSGGQSAGHGFGDDAAETIRDSKTLIEKVEEWGKFDEDVGFGSFTVDQPTEGLLSMAVSDPFLSRTGGAAEIFEGYISGVMESLLYPGERPEALLVDLWDEDVKWKWVSSWQAHAETVMVGWKDETLIMRVKAGTK